MARRPSKNTRKSSRIRGLVLRLAAVGLMLAVAYGGYLAWTATSEFEGRRWDIPAQVYAAPLELYTGRALSDEDLVAELKRLGYREDPRLIGPGIVTPLLTAAKAWAENTMVLARSAVHSRDGSQVSVPGSRSICMPRARFTWRI